MKLKLFLSSIILLFVVSYACKKQPEIPGNNRITIGQTTIDSSSYFNAQISTVISDLGGNSIAQHGHCWSTNEKPTIGDNHSSLGKIESPGLFLTNIEYLESNTKYYIRSYLDNGNSVIYGNQIFVTTLKTGKPHIMTSQVSDITLTSSICGGDVISDSGLFVTNRGICWDTAINVSVANSIGYTSDGDSLGTFISYLTGLHEGRIYYAKAYATNEKGTSYGEAVEFSTIAITLPEVTTTTPSNIFATNATSGGIVVSDGHGTVTSRGICWNTDGTPTLQNNLGFTVNDSGLGEFTSSCTGLIDNTMYYITAYGTNAKGTGYGTVTQFTTLTLSIPTVESITPSDITAISATSGGNITNNGNGSITSRGVCWNTTGSPTLENCDNFTVNGSGTGNYISYLTSLSEGTTYYLSAYATNEKGTAYGNTIAFSTLTISLPIVITTEPYNITTNSATSGGEVISNGNGTLTSIGVCWNTDSNPSLQNNIGYTVNGTSVGNFTSIVNNLNSSTIYFLTSYATNEIGTSYGETIQFETEALCGDLTISYGGQTYHTVKIGEQCWMKENLNIGTRINGSQGQIDNNQIEKYCYDDTDNNCDTYGALYQWDEMMQYSTSQGTQGICPTGWHIPSDEEWKVLEGTVDSQYGVGDPEWYSTGWRGFDAGKNLKSQSGWQDGGNGVDIYGFTAFPGGLRESNGSFLSMYRNGVWWSSDAFTSTKALQYWLSYMQDGAFNGPDDKARGMSVRCLKD